jgi:hypothetical protein
MQNFAIPVNIWYQYHKLLTLNLFDETAVKRGSGAHRHFVLSH